MRPAISIANAQILNMAGGSYLANMVGMAAPLTKIMAKCDAGYESTIPSFVATCLETGQWSTPTFPECQGV